MDLPYRSSSTEATHPAMLGVVVHGTAVIEWLEGEDLADFKVRAPMTLRRVLEVIGQVNVTAARISALASTAMMAGSVSAFLKAGSEAAFFRAWRVSAFLVKRSNVSVCRKAWTDMSAAGAAAGAACAW